MARSRSRGAAPGSRARPRCGRRIAPNPIRLTVRSPSFQVPAAAAVTVPEVIGEFLLAVRLWNWTYLRLPGLRFPRRPAWPAHLPGVAGHPPRVGERAA